MEVNCVKPTFGHLALLSLLLSCAVSAYAQSAPETRLEKLEETIRVLERRVANLEEQLRQRSAAPQIPSDKVAWRKLKQGMSEAEVEALLGSPTRVDAFGSFTVWIFGNQSRARVQFDGRSRTVTGWHEP